MFIYGSDVFPYGRKAPVSQTLVYIDFVDHDIQNFDIGTGHADLAAVAPVLDGLFDLFGHEAFPVREAAPCGEH